MLPESPHRSARLRAAWLQTKTHGMIMNVRILDERRRRLYCGILDSVANRMHDSTWLFPIRAPADRSSPVGGSESHLALDVGDVNE